MINASRSNSFQAIKMDPSIYNGLKRGDRAILQKLQEESPSIQRGITAQKDNVLHIAAGLGYTSLVTHLSNRDLLFAVNSNEDTPIHCAARAGHENVVAYLIDQMMTLNGTANPLEGMWNLSGDTPLHDAVRYCHLRAAYELIWRNPQLGRAVNYAGESAIYVAVERGAVKIVRMLLQFPNCVITGPNGQNALHAAVCRNYEMAEQLLKLKPDPSCQVDANGSSPLHFAVSIGDIKMTELLLNHNAFTAHILDKDGLSPIHVAATLGHTDMITKIIEHCPDAVELVNNKGRNFLHVAIENKRLNVVKYVLRSPTFTELINKPDSDGNTALHLAITNHNLQVVNLLLADNRTDARARNHKNLTPLDHAYLCVNSSIRLRMHRIMVQLVSAHSQFSPQRADYLIVNRCHREDEEEIDRCRTLANNLAIVAVLIASVAFAAMFTLPGGYRSEGSYNQGMAILVKRPSFKAFLISDSIAMASSLTVTCLLIYTGSLDHDIRVHSINTAMKFMWVALGGMVVAFATGSYVVVASDCKWLAILVCFMACSVPFIAWAIASWPTFDSLKLVKRARDQDRIVQTSEVMPAHLVADFQTPYSFESTDHSTGL